MDLDVSSLPENVADLKDVIASLVTIHEKNQAQIDFLEERIRLLQNELFGRKTEKHPKEDRTQLLLFNDAETAVEKDPQSDDSLDEITIPQHTRKKRGRKPLPKDLPRVEVVHDLTEEEKVCDCGCRLSRIGEDTSEKLDIIPAKIRVLRHIRYKYVCKSCEGVESEGPTVKIAPLPAQIIPKSIATPGLLAHMLVSKFEDALPFYRQEKIFVRMGIELPRSTMCGWAIKVAEQINPLLLLLGQEIRSGPLINIDETPVQVLNEPGRANTRKSYMWVFRGGDPDRPALVYQYHPTRSGQVPLTFLEGFKGFAQTDGYNGYDALGRQHGVVLVGCWAHARRKFDKVIKAKGNPKKKGLADEALESIRKLYAIEKEARKKELDPEQVYTLRQLRAKPVLDEFKTWLDHKASITPPKGLLGKAVAYALNHWKRLVRYIDDGRLRPDNNLIENAIRPFVVGRKNWLFSGHPNGANASAALYSLIETAKANGLKPYFYLRYLFDQLPLAETESDLKKLLPQNVDPAILDTSIT